MIRKKDKWQIRKQVGQFYISTVNTASLLYESNKAFVRDNPVYGFSEVMKMFDYRWETMVHDDELNEWIEQVRYKYKHRALKGHEEMIKKYEKLRDSNSKKEQQEITEQE